MDSKVKERLKVNNKYFKIPKFVAWFFPRRIWFGTNNNIYLTFDDGPHPEITPWLLDELRVHDVKASFFWNGNQIEKHPELLERALSEGHVVGHHGYKHQSSKNISLEAFKINFDKSRLFVKSDLFRPPHGELTMKQAKYALNNGDIVMWSWMSYDFDENISVEYILQKAKKQVRKRDILVFHENDKTIHRIKKIIPPIIQLFQDKGFNFAQIENKQ